MDGISDNDVNFNTYKFLPSIDALQEFKVQTGALYRHTLHIHAREAGGA